MPLQRIILSREAAKLLRWLKKKGPYEMREGVFEASAAAQELKEKTLADYEDGTLRLIKHCKT